MAMPDVRETFKEAWSHALTGLNAAEQEAEKVLGKIADAAGLSPEDVRRQAREFGERLQAQRRELERAIDEAVKRTTSRFRLPSREEIEHLRERVEAVSKRIDAMEEAKAAPPPAAPEEGAQA